MFTKQSQMYISLTSGCRNGDACIHVRGFGAFMPSGCGGTLLGAISNKTNRVCVDCKCLCDSVSSVDGLVRQVVWGNPAWEKWLLCILLCNQRVNFWVPQSFQTF